MPAVSFRRLKCSDEAGPGVRLNNRDRSNMTNAVAIGLNAVIVAVTRETPRLLTLSQPSSLGARPGEVTSALPFGPLDPARHRTLELCLRSWVREQTGIELGYVEQLYTFGDRNRERGPGQAPQNISIAYLALVQETPLSGSGARWLDWYKLLPWEDWRSGRPALIDHHILPGLQQWLERSDSVGLRRSRQERIDINFGCGGASWNWERVLDRYELLYEAQLALESIRDRHPYRQLSLDEFHANVAAFGRPLQSDHRRIVATALDRIRGKLKYRPVVFELLPDSFTLLQLQRLVEALAGLRLHKQNFRRLVEKGGLVEGTGERRRQGRGRPAELFRFRRDVLKERPAPGVGLPTLS